MHDLRHIPFLAVLLGIMPWLGGCAAAAAAAAETAPLTPGYISAFRANPKPVLLGKVTPEYPPGPQRLGLRGEVVLLFVVEVDGSVREAEVIDRISGSMEQRDFEQAALAAIVQWKFKAGEKDGVPVRVALRVPFGFGGR